MNWVDCSEKMPEEHESIFARFKGTVKWSNAMFEKCSDYVLVVKEFPDGTRKVDTSTTEDGVWKAEKSLIKCKVTHWMPYPELPNKE